MVSGVDILCYNWRAKRNDREGIVKKEMAIKILKDIKPGSDNHVSQAIQMAIDALGWDKKILVQVEHKIMPPPGMTALMPLDMEAGKGLAEMLKELEKKAKELGGGEL
jgi:hypothetical protein